MRIGKKVISSQFPTCRRRVVGTNQRSLAGHLRQIGAIVTCAVVAGCSSFGEEVSDYRLGTAGYAPRVGACQVHLE